MKKGITPNDEVEELATVAQLKKEEEAKHELTVKQADELYGDGQSYERLSVENEVRFYQTQMGNSLMEIGRRLLRIRAHEGHGGFLQTLDNLGMGERSAQYAMTAARKFSNTKTFSYLGNSKQLVLTVLDDDSIQTLENGGEVAGMTLDDIDRMTVNELRKNLREERAKRNEEHAAYDKNVTRIIEEKNAKITEMESLLNGNHPPTEISGRALNSLHLDFSTALSCAEEEMRKAIVLIDKAQDIPNITFEQLEAFTAEYKERFQFMCDMHEDLVSAFNYVHVPKPDKEDDHENETGAE